MSFNEHKHTLETKNKMSFIKKEQFRLGILKSPMLGKHHSEETKIKIGQIRKNKVKHGEVEVMKDKNHPNWKGDKVGYKSLHQWIKRNKPKSEYCEECKNQKSYDLANISGKYKRDINDYKWLCRKCHMIEDGRLNNLMKINKKLFIGDL